MKKVTIFISNDRTATVSVTPTRKTESTAHKEFLTVLDRFANYPEILVNNIIGHDAFIVTSQYSDISIVTHVKNIIAMYFDTYKVTEETNEISQITFTLELTGTK